MYENSGIYLIVNKVNGKKYVGSSQNLNQRWKKHKQDLKRKVHENDYLQNSYNKYGVNSFVYSVFESDIPHADLLPWEQAAFDFFDCCNRDKGYNIKIFAGSNYGTPNPKVGEANRRRVWKEESRRKSSQRMVTALTRGLLSKARLGYKFSAEQKAEIYTPEVRANLSKGRKGKPVSGEHREKLRIASTGRRHLPSAIEKCRQSKIGDKNPNFGAYGELNTNAKLTRIQVREIKILLREGKLLQREIGALYGVEQAHISSIKLGKTWGDVII
jgi:group I intron endonuclease